MTTFDAMANLASALVTVPPAPPAGGLTLTVDDASVFPAIPFNAVAFPPDVCADGSNAEIIRVTGIAGNVLTVDRAQEGTSAQAIAAGWQVVNTPTAGTFTAIENAINAIESMGVFDGDAAGGVLSGTYPNPGFAVDMATQAELDASILGAVILLPTTDGRNVIQPSAATVIPLTLKGFAAQSDDLLQVQDSTGAVLSRVNETGWLGIGVDPTVPLDIFRAVTASPSGAFEVLGLQSIINYTSPLANTGFSSNANYFEGRYVNVLATGNAKDHFTALAAYGIMDVPLPAAGDAVGVVGGDFWAESKVTNTYPIDSLQALRGNVIHSSPYTVPETYCAQFNTSIFGGTGTVTAVYDVAAGFGYLAHPVTIPSWNNFFATPPYMDNASAVVTNYHGLHVGTYAAGVGSIGTYYGALLENPNVTISGTKYAFVSRGGQSLLTAGAATEKPLVVKGAAAQSANLQEWQDSAAATLARITSAGVLAFGSSGDTNLYRSAADVLKTDDAMVIGNGLDMSSKKITSVLDPTLAQDAATKAYVDASISGINWKQAVALASTAALPPNVYANGASGVGATLTGVSVGALTIDGTAPALGARVLIKNEVAGANNGIYTVTAVGSGIAVYVLTRATDFDTSAEVVAGDTVFATLGVTNLDTSWVLTTTGTIVVGTTALAFSQYGTAVGPAGGDLTGTYPNPTLAAIGGAAGPTGGATTVPIVTIDAKGRVTALSSTTIAGTAPGGSAGGVLSGTYPNPGFAADMATQAELDLGTIDPAFFGDGSDGDVSISGTTTLVRDMYYNNLTITGTGVLVAAGFRVFVKGTLTVNASGIINADGANAAANAGGGFGVVGTVARGATGANGVSGAPGAAGAAFNASSGSANAIAYGGAGGAGGAGASGAGGAGGATSTPTAIQGTARQGVLALLGTAAFVTGVGSVVGGGGGGSGGGDATPTQGGGGGAAGNVLLINAKAIVNNGIIRAKGGNGAARGFGTNPGGGGGGGGGVVIVNTRLSSGSGTITAAGGTGGAGAGTGVAGSSGSAGTTFLNIWT